MLTKVRAGILVNNDRMTYDVVREDNGRMIDFVDAHTSTFVVITELRYIETKYHLYLVNIDSLRTHLEYGLHPELAWRPGKRRGILERIRHDLWESRNIANAIKQRRQDM